MQRTLETNAPKRRRSINIASNSLLTGLLYDEHGQRLSPVHSKKPNGRRYRYYISACLAKGEMDDGTALRLPAEQIEKLVVNRITELLSDTSRIINVAGLKNLTPSQVSNLETHSAALTTRLTDTGLETQRAALIDRLERVSISPTHLTLRLRRNQLLTTDTQAPPETDSVADEVITLDYPLQMRRRGVETKLIIGGQALEEPDPELIKLIAMSRDWYEGLKSGRYTSQLQIGSEHGLDKADVSRTLNLAFLSPEVVSEIIAGRHPVEMTVKSLKASAGKLRACWNDQAILLGVPA